MDVHSNAAVSGNVLEDFLSFENMEGGDGVSLEWLSIFVEECLNGGFPAPTPTPTHITYQTPSPIEAQQESPQPNEAQTDPIQVPCKRRTKRRKINTNENNSLHSFHVSVNFSDPPPLLPQAYWLADSELIFPKKESENYKSRGLSPQLKPQEQVVKAQDENHGPRMCSHCLSNKTPQWRAGPLGPKSLCNACGVRFKSGRLLPEYRPAKSPTFESFKHSNSHKKVLEMRMATVFSSETN